MLKQSLDSSAAVEDINRPLPTQAPQAEVIAQSTRVKELALLQENTDDKRDCVEYGRGIDEDFGGPSRDQIRVIDEEMRRPRNVSETVYPILDVSNNHDAHFDHQADHNVRKTLGVENL